MTETALEHPYMAELAEAAPLTGEQWKQIPPISPTMTIPGMYAHRAKVHPGSVVAEKRMRFGSLLPVTIEEFLAEVEVYARGLIGLGVQPGESVALLAANSYQWMVMDVAILSAGAIMVPIYESDSAQQIRHILDDAKIVALFTDTSQQADLVESVRGEGLRDILSFDRGAAMRLQSLARQVAPVEADERLANMGIDDVATIIYTSGTTGVPKGVVLTHKNIVATTASIHSILFDIAQNPQTRILLFLPLAHVLARFVMHGISVGAGRVGFSPDTKNLVADIAAFQPTLLLVVPRVLEKVYNSAHAKAGGGLKSKVFGWSARRAKELGGERERDLAAKRNFTYTVANALVLKKVRAVMGANLKYVVCGGAPLSTELAQFYRGLGLTVMVGYGLSESTGPVTVQRPNYTPQGTSGPAIPLNEVMIDETDGEILLRGASIFQGYHNLPEATAAAFTDGWFRTGDVGRIDEDGQVLITGRKKGILVTAGGKNVSPEALEDPLSTHPLIGHVVVVGDAKPFIGALVTLDPDMLPGWLMSKGLPVVDPVTAAEMPEVRESLQRAIRRANKNVSRAESIRRFNILNAAFTVENGYLTPSLKLRRNKVLQDFAGEVEGIYEGEGEDVAEAP